MHLSREQQGLLLASGWSIGKERHHGRMPSRLGLCCRWDRHSDNTWTNLGCWRGRTGGKRQVLSLAAS